MQLCVMELPHEQKSVTRETLAVRRPRRHQQAALPPAAGCITVLLWTLTPDVDGVDEITFAGPPCGAPHR